MRVGAARPDAPSPKMPTPACRGASVPGSTRRSRKQSLPPRDGGNGRETAPQRTVRSLGLETLAEFYRAPSKPSIADQKMRETRRTGRPVSLLAHAAGLPRSRRCWRRGRAKKIHVGPAVCRDPRQRTVICRAKTNVRGDVRHVRSCIPSPCSCCPPSPKAFCLSPAIHDNSPIRCLGSVPA